MADSGYKELTTKLLEYLDAKDKWLQGTGPKPWFKDTFDSQDEMLQVLTPTDDDSLAKKVYDQGTKNPENRELLTKEPGYRLAVTLEASALRTVRHFHFGAADTPRVPADDLRDGRYNNAMAAANIRKLKIKLDEYTNG